MSLILDVSYQEGYDQYLDDVYYHDEQESIKDVWNNCVILSIFSIGHTITNLIVLNFCFGCVVATGLFSNNFLHLISGLIGTYLLGTLASGKLLLIGCFTCSYVIIVISCSIRKYQCISSANFVKIVTIPLLILCEYYSVGSELWLEIRGTVMVLVMKIISLADDIQQTNCVPNIFQYFGYTLCGANVMFGPWISFNEYIALYDRPTKKNIYWIINIIRVLINSFFFLTISNCWATYFITEDSNRFIEGYKEAFSFRTSHYFICYLSEVGMIAAGFTNSSKCPDSTQWRYIITEPLQVEFPSSLSMVVKKWNQPMHEFLKKYVYRSWLGYGKFYSILATFVMSSFLHGFEAKVSAVLVTIGIFSYLQVVARDKIAEIFDCCIRVRPCKNCQHKYKRSDIRVKLMLLIYSFVTVFHLVYLGVLMDPSTDEIGIYGKWQNFYFLGHIVMFTNILIIS